MQLIQFYSDKGGDKFCGTNDPFDKEKGHSKDLYHIMAEVFSVDDPFDFNTALLCGNCYDAYLDAMLEIPNVVIHDTDTGIELFRIEEPV